MTATEVIDFSMRVYQNLGWLILKLTAVPSAFGFAGIAFLYWIVLPKLGVTSDASSMRTQVAEGALTLVVAFAVAVPIAMIGFSISSAIIVKLVASFIEGSLPNPDSAVQAAKRAFWPTLKLTMFESLVGCSGIVGSTLLLMLSALLDSQSPDNKAMSGLVSAIGAFGFLFSLLIFLAVVGRHALSGPIVVLEGRGAIESARRSAHLMKGNASHLSGYASVWIAFFLIAFLSVVLLPAFVGLLGLVDLEALIANFSGIPILGEALSELLAMAPFFLFVWVAVPIWCTTTAILYFERRIRIEGYDIETLARDMVRNRKESRFEL